MNQESISQSIAIVHPITLSHGRNAEVWDTDGKRYIDFVGGIGVLNLGHCNPAVVEAIQLQATRLTHYAFNAAPHGPYLELMERCASSCRSATPWRACSPTAARRRRKTP
jgi:4-aminobutyrate aminotransferase-like enzyme